MVMPNRSDECVRFGRTVRLLREARGLSQEDFADRIAIHRTYIGGIERGERNPTLLTIARIAEALGVPPWKLLKDRDA
jgi:transcriptional regulator with XRE-family HTH domain